MEDFSVSVTTRGTTSVVTVLGDIDMATSERLRTAIAAELRPGHDVAVDCSGVRFMDSTGLRVLLDLDRGARAAGSGLILVAPSAVVVRIMELAGVAELFTVRPAAVP